MKKFIERFNTQEKCKAETNDMEDAGGRLLYWKDAGGLVIRESEVDDNIGTKKTFATIQITDMLGCDKPGALNSGIIEESHFKFAVLLFVNSMKDGSDLFDTIEEAVADYLKKCVIVKNLTESTLDKKILFKNIFVSIMKDRGDGKMEILDSDGNYTDYFEADCIDECNKLIDKLKSVETDVETAAIIQSLDDKLLFSSKELVEQYMEMPLADALDSGYVNRIGGQYLVLAD